MSVLASLYKSHIPKTFSSTTTAFYKSHNSRVPFFSLVLNRSLVFATMITPRRLIKLARKWQKLAAAQRKRITFPTKSSFVARKGHFVVYTTDEKRFMVPLELLSRNVFVELFRLSEEEFGLPTDGPITLPCDSAFLEYIVQLVRGCIADELEKALLTSLTCHVSALTSSSLQQNHQQMLIICGF